MIELEWAAAPERAGTGFAEARAEAERILAAVKASKDWSQPSWAADGVVKSSLDGVRESVLDEALFGSRARTPVASDLREAAALRRAFGVHGAERLCGVGLLKRFGNDEGDPGLRDDAPGRGERAYRVFSTSHVASGPFRAGLARLPHGASVFTEYVSGLEEDANALGIDLFWNLDVVPSEDPVTGYLDGAMFYEGRLLEEIEEASPDPASAQRLTRKALRRLRRFLAGASRLGEPIPYYAILLADGDRMGAAIAACTTHDDNRALSRALEHFASGARQTVSEHEGRLVYSGGDDVLALLPLHRVLDCAARLESDFRAAVAPWPTADGLAPTLSVGIAIVHALDPLDESLALVRRAESRAKNVPGKNGLCIAVQPRGGATVEATGSFSQNIVGRLRKLIELHRRDLLPARAQYELMDVAARTGAPDCSDVLLEVARAEARRILARKQPNQGAMAKIAADVLQSLEALGAYDDPGRLGRELYVASHFARALEQAEPIDEVAT